MSACTLGRGPEDPPCPAALSTIEVALGVHPRSARRPRQNRSKRAFGRGRT